ncbi:18796_t:CDS:2, partial [Acaulospora morrowiae]
MQVSALECKEFTASEGQYTLKENIFIEARFPNLTSGTSVSIVSVKYKEYSNRQNSSNADGNLLAIDRGDENISDIRPTSATESTLVAELDEQAELDKLQQQAEPLSPVIEGSNIGSPIQVAKSPTNNGSVPTAIEGKKDDDAFSVFNVMKRKKAKGNITKTTSSLVAKMTQNENLAKILANRQSEDTYLFFNVGRTFCWIDLTYNPKDPLSKIEFTKHPICHDVNLLTRSYDHLDVIIGFSSGDLVWIDPLCSKYYRLNKQGLINNTPVTMVKWVPGTDNLFMVSHQDGSMILYDKDRDDQNFTSTVGNEEEGFRVIRPAKNSKHNPVSYWQVSKKTVTAFSFSPDHQYVATVSVDGYLRIIDFMKEALYDAYSSYFGGFSCVCWSPDGKYVLTGGQDDLVTIWAFREQRIVARCQGHQSWVTGVSFDSWNCDERNYRFGSVGEDTKLLLWDFSVNALHKPKSSGSHRRASLASQSHTATFALRRNLGEREHVKDPVHHCLPRLEVAILQPITGRSIDGEPLCSITFREDSIITTCRKGHIKLWARPDFDK